MQINKAFLLLFFLLNAALCYSQNKAIITLNEKEFNFGTVRETEGMVNHDFVFTNQGKVPLIINDVKSTCGCTVPSWPHEPVLPGQTGTIKVAFNPERQSGAIVKTIQILSNADVPQIALTLKGVVIPAERVEQVYKFNIGDLRLQTIYAAIGEIYKGKTGNYSIQVFNNATNQPMTISFKKVPAHLDITVTPAKIEPQQEGTIHIQYNSAATANWDYTVDRLDLMINGAEVPNNRINVTANIKEDFSQLTSEQLAGAAIAQFDSHDFDFGSISADKIVEHSFKLSNSGKSNLYIRKVSASCGCTAVQPEKTTILPGESTEIKAIFNARGRSGAQKKAITVITNDPKKSRTILWINALVEQPVNP